MVINRAVVKGVYGSGVPTSSSRYFFDEEVVKSSKEKCFSRQITINYHRKYSFDVTGSTET